MGKIKVMDDEIGRSEAECFSYRVTKDGKVFISWYGKWVTTLSGSKADSFIHNISVGKDAQLLMAKATGHFKHGNET